MPLAMPQSKSPTVLRAGLKAFGFVAVVYAIILQPVYILATLHLVRLLQTPLVQTL